jgi:hypothetical protein
MARIPLLAGTKVAVVSAPPGAVVLRPPPPGDLAIDVPSAVRDALRFPLAGEPLAALAERGGRATIVVEPPALPLPGSERDPRKDAIAATVDALERVGIPSGYQTVLVAGGLARRLGTRDLEELVTPDFARRFHGQVEVHDVERDDLVEVGESDGIPLRINPALARTGVVIVITSAETVLHGGPAALLGAANKEALRAAGAASLLEPGSSRGWELALALERALSRRIPVLGVSLVLNHPRISGALRGYPYEPEADERVVRSPARHLFGLLPGWARQRVLRALPLELTAAGAFAGPPSVAHAEALLRGVEQRSADLAEPVDTLVLGVPRATPYLPRERPNPLLVAYLALGFALRLWRDAFPVREGGTVILLHRFHRHFSHPTQQPYRAFFGGGGRSSRSPEALAAAEAGAGRDERALQSYRDGRSCHPLLPFADWDACAPTLSHLGAVLVGGCRDDVAARQLGFVPVHGIGAALGMARARAVGEPRTAFLLSPPYFPLRVGSR